MLYIQEMLSKVWLKKVRSVSFDLYGRLLIGRRFSRPGKLPESNDKFMIPSNHRNKNFLAEYLTDLRLSPAMLMTLVFKTISVPPP